MQTTENTYGKSGVPVMEVHGVHDGSKIKSLMDCPRGYFFTHILGWEKEQSNIHLNFGSGMHAGFEHIYEVQNFADETIFKAYQDFMQVWNQAYIDDPMFEGTRAKNPDQMLKMLASYASYYPREFQEWKTLYTEVSGVVPINADGSRILHFNMDVVQERQKDGMIRALEHKSTGRESSKWAEQWEYVFQPHTYYYALVAHYGIDKVLECMINGVILRAPTKSKAVNIDFMRVPIKKSRSQISLWLGEANHWWDYFDWNMELLSNTSPSDEVMHAFPRNTASCAKSWQGCKCNPFCHDANPLRNIQPQIGYVRGFWDPRAREVTNYNLDLTKTDATFTEVKREETDE